MISFTNAEHEPRVPTHRERYYDYHLSNLRPCAVKREQPQATTFQQFLRYLQDKRDWLLMVRNRHDKVEVTRFLINSLANRLTSKKQKKETWCLFDISRIRWNKYTKQWNKEQDTAQSSKALQAI
jgi:hypothetical protein